MRTLSIIFLIIQTTWSFAQTNTYTSITSPSLLTANTTYEFDVNNATGFNIGDKVLIIQMQGAEISTTYGNITNIQNAGNYEFAYICQVSGTTVTLASPVLKNYDITGKVQMINIPQYTNHTINTRLQASQSWNGNTGGVLVFEVDNILTLNANIDLTGQGFRGGEKSDNNSFCSSPTESASITNYISNTPNLAGGKGEGVATTTPSRARGKIANGGGGGNTFEGGGGGGANGGSGGMGGFGKNSTFVFGFCTGVNSSSSNPDKQGIGGLSMSSYFTNEKVFLGGGGGGGQATNGTLTGGGTQNSGNGGGIIIILAKEIVGNGHSIMANGENVLSTPFSGAGADGNSGAGAGGTILLNINTYTTTLNLEAKGGNGGNTSSGDGNHYAPGGGGGGGLIWVSHTTLPSAITGVSIDVSGGSAGISNNGSATNNFGATNGSMGIELNNLIIPENGGVPLTGVYTVGGISPDFIDLETAINQVNTAGINADVTLNIRNGTYIESSSQTHTLDNFRVCATSATLIIQSESGNPDDVIIQTNNATSTALMLKNTNNIVINNLTLENIQAIIAAPNDFNEAFIAENTEARLHNIKCIGGFEANTGSNLTLTGSNHIENGNLVIAATINNEGTLTVGSGSGGNVRFQTNANFINIDNNIIHFQGRTWIEEASSASFTANTGTVHLNSTSWMQEIQAGANTHTFYNLEVNNNQNINLQASIEVENNLILTDGIVNTLTNEVIFRTNYPETNNPSETNASHIMGLARMQSKNIGTGTLQFLGLDITGSEDIGNVSILRYTGTNAIQTLPNGANSIACTWNISASQQPTTNRSVTFTWLDIWDNANNPTEIAFWQKESNNWTLVQESIDASSNPRQSNLNLTSLGELTFGNKNVDLLSFLDMFEGTKINIQTNDLFWNFSDTSNLAELVLEKSANNINFTTIANITDLSIKNFEDNEGLGSFYYRLKLVGINGFEVYSDTVFLEELDRTFALVPNPLVDVVNIQSTFPRTTSLNFKLKNLRGQEIVDFKGTLEALETYLQNFMSSMPIAMYIIETEIDGRVYTQKIIRH